MMILQRLKSIRTLAIALSGGALLWTLAIAPAEAHHAMGGQLPTTIWQGLLSGLGHPIVGLDHFAFVIALGMVSAFYAHGWRLPIAFLVSAMAGTGLHVMKVDLPIAETGVALSVVALGVLLLRRMTLPTAGWIALLAIAGIFHGYAYGESIVGAELSPIVGYLIGFTAIQSAIALAAYVAVSAAGAKAIVWHRVFGAISCAIGAFFLVAR